MSLEYRVLPSVRRSKLRNLLDKERLVRVMEAHNGLSAIVASKACGIGVENVMSEFNGLWVSSLTSSASKGLPDTELNNLERRIETIQEILSSTNKPVIVDGDTGGEALNFEYLCSKLESLGVSAIVIEDKQYPKRNSLSLEAEHILADIDVFARKIKRGRDVLLSNDFMIFARLESLIAKKGVDDAIFRARKYLQAGADGLMIHSKAKTVEEVRLFLDKYEDLCKELGSRKPVICVPTTYNTTSDEELFSYGANIVVHANQLLRASHLAMQNVCEVILNSNRSLEVEELCIPLTKLFETVGFNDAIRRDIID